MKRSRCAHRLLLHSEKCSKLKGEHHIDITGNLTSSNTFLKKNSMKFFKYNAALRPKNHCSPGMIYIAIVRKYIFNYFNDLFSKTQNYNELKVILVPTTNHYFTLKFIPICTNMIRNK